MNPTIKKQLRHNAKFAFYKYIIANTISSRAKNPRPLPVLLTLPTIFACSLIVINPLPDCESLQFVPYICILVTDSTIKSRNVHNYIPKDKNKH